MFRELKARYFTIKLQGEKTKTPELYGPGVSGCCMLCYSHFTQKDIPEPDFSAAPTMIPMMRMFDIVICFACYLGYKCTNLFHSTKYFCNFF